MILKNVKNNAINHITNQYSYFLEKNISVRLHGSRSAHQNHVTMTSAVAVASVLLRRLWSIRFHRAALTRSTTCISVSHRGLTARSGDLAARHCSAWPLARTLSSLAARTYRMALVVAVGYGDCGFEALGFD